MQRTLILGLRGVVFASIIMAVSCCVTVQAQQWTPSIPNMACYSVAVNPLDKRVVYVGNIARTLLKSLDGGTTWEPFVIGSGGPGGASLITSLFVHPRDTAVLLAGGTSFAGLDRSTDGGQTWENVLVDPNGVRFEVASSAAITVNATNPDSMYVMRNNPPYLYRSINAGRTWDSVGAIEGLPSQGRIRALSIAPDSSNILLAGGRAAYVRRSTDHGKTWTAATNDLGLSDAEIARFVWSPTTPGKVYATAIIQNTSSGGLHVSSDWGLTWTTMRFKDTSLMALSVQPTPSGDEIFVGGNLLELYNSTLFGDSIVYRTVNGGTNWQSLDSIPWSENETGKVVPNVWDFAITYPGTAPEILMATESGLFRSTFVTDVAEVAEDPAAGFSSSPSQPPTLRVVHNTVVLSGLAHSFDAFLGHGAQGATSLELISMTGAVVFRTSMEGLNTVPGVDGSTHSIGITIPTVTSGCYVVRVSSGTQSVSAVALLGY